MTSLQIEQYYRRPFDILQLTSGQLQRIVPSVKFSKQFLDRNRYYIDAKFKAEIGLTDLHTIAKELWMPKQAQQRMYSEFDRFGQLAFLGAGLSHGNMAYRIYLGFESNQKLTGDSAVSIDWVPTTGKYLTKTYNVLDQIPITTGFMLLRDALSSKKFLGFNGIQLAVYTQCATIIGKAQGLLYATRIHEPDSERHSVSFNYYFVTKTKNHDIQQELNALAELFKLPSETYHQWLHDTAELRLVDVAVGLAWNGEPFVTIYHGDLSEPPSYYHDEKALRVSSTSVIPVS